MRSRSVPSKPRSGSGLRLPVTCPRAGQGESEGAFEGPSLAPTFVGVSARCLALWGVVGSAGRDPDHLRWIWSERIKVSGMQTEPHPAQRSALESALGGDDLWGV